MYEGYVCLGGTEIINNPRAVGYASTASQIDNYWAPGHGYQPAHVLARNMFPNPSFEADSGDGSVPGVSPSGGVEVTRSDVWSTDRAYSVLIHPTGTDNSTAARIAGIGVTEGVALEAGQMYTVLATRHLENPIPDPEPGYAGRIVLSSDVGVQYSEALPNVAGDGTIRWTFTVDPTATVASLYLGNGSASEDVWWDSLLISEGRYGGLWFDGSTASTSTEYSYLWEGLPDEAPSIQLMNHVSEIPAKYCDINWFDGNECNGLYDALTIIIPPPSGDYRNPWEAQYILEDAPWASGSVYEDARKFLGVYGLEITSLSDSTRSAEVIQGITDGGIIGRTRNAVPTFRFRVLLTAVDEMGLEYGTAWLSRALSEQACSSHGPSCGSTDLTFFAACPPPAIVFEDPDGREDPNYTWDLMTRQYHDVKCIEGPIVVEEYHRDPNSWGRIVEFTLAAGVPSLFGLMGLQSGIVDQDTSQIFTDIPRNAIPTPSAELASTDTAVVATNYSLNPSVETNATGWNTAVDGTAITTAMVTSGRVTGELAAVGTASFRAVFTATGASSTPGWFAVQQEVDISARDAGASVSINFWSAELLMAGAPVRGDITFTAIWRNAGVSVGQTNLGTAPVNGGSVSSRSLVVPPTATSVLVRATANITSWNAGTIVRLYGDALLVSVP